MLFLCVHHRGLSHQPTTKRASRPHLLVHSTKPTSSHTTQNMRSENSSQQPCKSNLLPLISSTSICAQNRSTTECSKRDTVDKTKQRHLKQQSRPLHHVPTLPFFSLLHPSLLPSLLPISLLPCLSGQFFGKRHTFTETDSQSRSHGNSNGCHLTHFHPTLLQCQLRHPLQVLPMECSCHTGNNATSPVCRDGVCGGFELE